MRHLKAIGYVGRTLHEPNNDTTNRHRQHQTPNEDHQTNHHEIKKLNASQQLGGAALRDPKPCANRH